ncbi:hypothetical protein KVT40_003708 [Elsinoe batatas]|uniref:Uncharacterized protein n=1 Tax=Elsinoe batatas TaxID=2601811 RepID=A0A8K0L5H2_9PEZI|nr:hypothetical protein KVT40_003708 [Elsinoe batatas]
MLATAVGVPPGERSSIRIVGPVMLLGQISWVAQSRCCRLVEYGENFWLEILAEDPMRSSRRWVEAGRMPPAVADVIFAYCGRSLSSIMMASVGGRHQMLSVSAVAAALQ